MEVRVHLGSTGHVRQRMQDVPRRRDLLGFVVVHAVGGLSSISVRLSRQLDDVAEVHVADLAKVPPAVDGLDGGRIGRAGRGRVCVARGERAHPGLDGSETVSHFGPGISGKLWDEGLHHLLVDCEQLLRPLEAAGGDRNLGSEDILALGLVAPGAIVTIAGAAATYWPLAITLETLGFKMEHSSWRNTRQGTGSGSTLTFDFLARQLLQALVIRLRFNTGASDISVVL